MIKKPTIAILATDGEHLNVAYNFLKDKCKIATIVVEEAMSKKKMIDYRIKKLGYFKVFGQILFIGSTKLLAPLSQSRKNEITQQLGIDFTNTPREKITFVSSVNSNACRKALKKEAVDFVFVVGTRIIGKKTLTAINKPFVNSHAGITPRYRGVHGGYWALANSDKENCGVTIHYVDTGVDTGDIIAQSLITPTKEDSFFTYPLLQQHKGLELLIQNFQHILDRKPGFERDDLESKQWFHPTLWFYVKTWLTKGVK